jgi:radical SAM protein with 4Fe4S-binding SPASM domain
MDLSRIRLDQDGFITQDALGRMQRFPLSRFEVDSIKAAPDRALQILTHRFGWAGASINPKLGVRFDVGDDAVGCLSRPLRIYYGIEPHCNLACAGCGPRDFKHRFISISSDFEDFLLQEIANAGAFQVQLTGGEIALRGFQIFDVLDKTRRLGLAVILATNGVWSHLLQPEQFVEKLSQYDNIIQTNISIDGTPESHERIRGVGTYGETVATLERLARSGLRPRITSTIFRFTCNRKELEHLVGLATKYGAALQVIPVRLTGRASGHSEQMPSKEQLLEYTHYASELRKQSGVQLSFNFDIFEGARSVPIFDVRNPVSCGAPLWGVHLTHTGEVYPCGFAQTAKGNACLIAGRVTTPGSLLNIWLHSDVLRQIRSAGKSATCNACEHYGRGCWGGCWVAAWVETGETRGMDPYCIKFAGLGPNKGNASVELEGPSELLA